MMWVASEAKIITFEAKRKCLWKDVLYLIKRIDVRGTNNWEHYFTISYNSFALVDNKWFIISISDRNLTTFLYSKYNTKQFNLMSSAKYVTEYVRNIPKYTLKSKNFPKNFAKKQSNNNFIAISSRNLENSVI